MRRLFAVSTALLVGLAFGSMSCAQSTTPSSQAQAQSPQAQTTPPASNSTQPAVQKPNEAGLQGRGGHGGAQGRGVGQGRGQGNAGTFRGNPGAPAAARFHPATPVRPVVVAGGARVNLGNRVVFHPGGVAVVDFHRPLVLTGGRPIFLLSVRPYPWFFGPPGWGYCGGYWFGGVYFGGLGFYCGPGWIPTAFTYYPGDHYWYDPRAGDYYFGPPPSFQSPITVAIAETVTDPNNPGNTGTVTYYYNAYWNPTQGVYTYKDRNGQTQSFTPPSSTSAPPAQQP